MNALDKAICINLDVSIWQGRRVLRPEDLHIEGDKLPPAELASLGSKKIADPEDIKVFNTLKKKAERICSRKSVRFLGGYATSEEAITEIAEELDKIQHEFIQAKSDFLASYEQKAQGWINQFPEWGDVLKRAQVPKSVVDSRMRFDYQVFKIIPAEGVGDDQSGIKRAESGLSGQLFNEVSKEANEVWERSFRNRDVVSQKAISPIRKILEKLETLAFLDGKVGAIITAVKDVLDQMPATGAINGSDLFALIGVLNILSSKGRMQSFCPKSNVSIASSQEAVVHTIVEQDEVKPEQRSVLNNEVAVIENDRVVPHIEVDPVVLEKPQNTSEPFSGLAFF
jgi:hypothetical protein